ncbi:MAG: 4-hydroxy-tetrahydrodipicolinate synthase [Firmicutes bacterium]|nr:4-hydroxy-tetrahydrodipicolinate synthase [Bacillota bacterium]
MKIFEGCCTALITPFDKNNKVDFNEFKKIIDYQIRCGISALLFLGTTGEAATMTDNEKLEVVDFAVKYVNHRVKVLVGAGNNCTAKAIETARAYEKLGVDALLEVTPYYNKTSQTGLIAHFSAIANAVKTPIILYNVPSRTGINIEVDTIYELSKVENIVGIKQAISNINEVQRTTQIPNFAVYCGEDALNLAFLAAGADGFISVASNIAPKDVIKVYDNFKQGNLTAARETMNNLLPLIKHLFIEVNPMPIKYAMNSSGYQVGACRLPLVEVSNENKSKIDQTLKDYDLSQN